MMNSNYICKQSGITLVELIVTIVVVAVAVTGVLLAVQFSMRHSADPMIRQQQVAIADAYMEEIMLREYDRDSANASLDAADRPQFLYVSEYKNLNETHKPRNQNNNPLGLSQYEVTVEVTPEDLGPNNATAAKIEVIVDHHATNAFTLIGYKTRH